MLQTASIIALIIMVAGFIGLKVISSKQQTLPNANLYAILDLAVVFICAGVLIWNEFLYDLVVDKEALQKDKRVNSFKVQGYGVADYIKNNGFPQDDILIITVATVTDEELEGFKKGLAEGGLSGSFEVSKIGKEVGGPAGMGPVGIPGGVSFTYKDIMNAIKDKKGGTVINLAGLSSDVAMSSVNKSQKKKFGLNKNCKVIFAGMSTSSSPALRNMVAYEFIDAAVYSVKYPDARESMSGDFKAKFAEYYAIADKSHPMAERSGN